MSIPTYVRRRRVKDPVDYIRRFLHQEGKDMPPEELLRILQLRNQWAEDFEGYYINPTKRFVYPYWLMPKRADEQEITLAAAGAAGDQIRGVEYFIDNQGHMEIAYSMFQATSPRFLVEIFDPNIPRNLQNREIHARCIGGDGAQRPFIWPESYFMNVEEAPRSLIVGFRNLSDSTNKIRWCFHGRRWYHKEADDVVRRAMWDRWARREKTYTYFLTVTPQPDTGRPPDIVLAANQELRENQAPRFVSDSAVDTEVHLLTMVLETEDQSAAQVEFALRLGRSGRILANAMVSTTSGWGLGTFPFRLPETLLIERNLELRLELRELAGKETTIYPCLVGRRLQYE